MKKLIKQSKRNKKAPIHDLVKTKEIKRLMREKGMSVRTLAKKLGVPPKLVRYWLNEADQRYLSLNVLIIIARVLNVSIDDLISYTWEESKEKKED